MNPHETDRRHFERQIAYGRPIIVLLALIALLQQPSSEHGRRAISFLIGYIILSLCVVLFEKIVPSRSWHLPLLCDLAALGYFMVVSPSMVPAWFPYLFVCYVAGIRWGLNSAFPLAGVLSLELVLLTAVKGEIHWLRVVYWVGFVAATFAAGAGVAFLGDRNRLFAVQNEFFARITGTMEVDQGLSECLRLFLDELTRAFQAAEALLVYRDTDLERIFLWRLKSGESERLIPESLPMTRAEGLLLDDADATICWNSLNGAGSGFGWDRRDGRTLKTLPRLPGPTQQLLALRSMMSVTLDQGGQAAGRLFLLNGRNRFCCAIYVPGRSRRSAAAFRAICTMASCKRYSALRFSWMCCAERPWVRRNRLRTA